MCDMTEDDFEVPIKGVIVGNGAVGKSSMIQVGQLVNRPFLSFFVSLLTQFFSLVFNSNPWINFSEILQRNFHVRV